MTVPIRSVLTGLPGAQQASQSNRMVASRPHSACNHLMPPLKKRYIGPLQQLQHSQPRALILRHNINCVH
jgi:hypothetical protein